MPLTEQQINDLRGLGSNLSLDEEPRWLRAFIYGDFGHGKTDLVAKIIDAIGGRAMMVTNDAGWVTVKKYPEIAKKIVRQKYDGFNQMKMLAQAKMEGIEPFAECETLVWDTVSTGIALTLRNLVNQKKFNDQIDPRSAGWTHYNITTQLLLETIEVLEKADMHLIYTAHVREPTEQDRSKKKFNIRPNGPEACYNILAREANLIGWLYKEAKGGQRKIQFEPTNTETAKSQISTIPEGTYLVDQVPEMISKWISL